MTDYERGNSSLAPTVSAHIHTLHIPHPVDNSLGKVFVLNAQEPEFDFRSQHIRVKSWASCLHACDLNGGKVETGRSFGLNSQLCIPT